MLMRDVQPFLSLVWADSHRDTVGGGGVDWRGDSPDVWSCGHHSQSPELHNTHPCPPPLQVRYTEHRPCSYGDCDFHFETVLTLTQIPNERGGALLV